MSATEALGIAPGRRPVTLSTFRNGHGWSPSIWQRLLAHHGGTEHWMFDDAGLNRLWQSVETLPEWQQVPLVLTFDTGVIPYQAYDWAADQLIEFERRLPAPDGHVNHVPAMALVLANGPDSPFFGVWGTSVSENPFDPWDEQADEPGSGIPLDEMYVLERHRKLAVSR
jgi:hypothetical protein